jgi:hypothetical protein
MAEASSTRICRAAAETHADITFALTCVACAHRWQLALDIVLFLWSEISRAAKRYLRDGHTLAWAYGWQAISWR